LSNKKIIIRENKVKSRARQRIKTTTTTTKLRTKLTYINQ